MRSLRCCGVLVSGHYGFTERRDLNHLVSAFLHQPVSEKLALCLVVVGEARAASNLIKKFGGFWGQKNRVHNYYPQKVRQAALNGRRGRRRDGGWVKALQVSIWTGEDRHAHDLHRNSENRT